MATTAKYMRSYYQRNLKRERLRKRANRVGISIALLEELTKRQRNRCAVCKKKETQNGPHGAVRELSIDHDHKTGAIRGLLCSTCNTAIGKLYDSPKLLRAAAYYLERRPT